MRSSSSGRLPEVCRVLLALLLAVAVLAGPALAASAERRTVLYLYDGTGGETDDENDGDELWATPLSYLGLVLEKRDTRSTTPPSEAELADCRGFIAPVAAWSTSEEWCRFVASQRGTGRRLLILTSLAGTEPVTAGTVVLPDELLNQAYGACGLHVESRLDDGGLSAELVRVKARAPGWFGYEAPLADGDCVWYTKVEPLVPGVEPLLTLWWEGIPGSESALVAFTPSGGFAADDYLLKVAPDGELRQWRLDPVRFLERVFAVEGLPRPEINLVNGGRTYFSHVDGDGFNSYSEVREGQICAAVLHDEIYTHPAYGRLPVTLSVIAAEMDPGTTLCLDMSRAMASKLFALPNVEVAAHGYSHPMDWRTGELAWPDLPVNGTPIVFDPRRETLTALETATALAPPGKRAAIMLWTGNCNPDGSTLDLVTAAGYENMNGGDTRYDEKIPSLTGVAPPAVRVGSGVRIQTGAANDYIFTDDWVNFGGFAKVLTTFERSSSPRLILPVNVYYHFYAGEKVVALDALRRILAWCMRQDLTPVWTSDYCRMVRSLRSARFGRLAEGGFFVEQDGWLPTLRFDGAEGRFPDESRCRGVLGYRHLQGSLYVYLDGGKRQEIVLGAAEPRGFGLIRSNRPLRSLTRDGDGFSFRTWGPPRGSFAFRGLRPGLSYGVVLQGEHDRPEETSFHVDGEGQGRFSVALTGPALVEVTPITGVQFVVIALRRFFWGPGRFVLLLLSCALLGGWLVTRSGRRIRGRAP